MSAVARQVEVKQDQSGPGHVGEAAPPAQELQGLLAIAHHMQLIAYPVMRKGFFRYQHVAGVVLDQQHVDSLKRGSGGHEGLLTGGDGRGVDKR
jgi:hypothetical protein